MKNSVDWIRLTLCMCLSSDLTVGGWRVPIEKVREKHVDAPVNMVPTVRRSQGIQKYHGAKVNKDAEKTELLHAHCIQQFKIFSARFARRLFILFHLFCRPCF